MNKLQNVLSPYLLQHKDNPVNWYEWGDEAFDRARERDMPVLLSIGYAACHWCHVMAHESFDDQKTADYLNAHFICIKVDREERPDIDNVYMQVVIQMIGHGGWPLNVFLTPDKIPFFGGTYFPKIPSYGMISFFELLENIVGAWNNQRNAINQSSAAVSRSLHQEATENTDVETIEKTHIATKYDHLINNVDSMNGGFLGAPKFPQIPLWSSIFMMATQMNNSQLLAACYLTANKICHGGIYDHLAGGFFRYSTDENWLVPHFEKMLYDNALMIEWLAALYAYKPQPIFKARIYETIDWLTTEMQLKNHFFATSLDADSEGQEGKFYTWDWQELTTLLGDDLPTIAQYYELAPQGNWEGKIILHGNFDKPTQLLCDKLPTIQKKLLQQRQLRIRPKQDDKILLDWNALLITALCKASVIFNESKFLHLATNLYAGLQQFLRFNGKWCHAYRENKRQLKPLLEDYAGIIQGLIALFCATGKKSYLADAEQYVNETTLLFYNPDAALFHQTSVTESDLPLNPFPINDNVTPSGNGMMAINFVQLHLLTGKEIYENSFINLSNALSPALNSEHCTQFSMMINAINWYEHGLKIQGDWTKNATEVTQILPYYLLVQNEQEDWICCDKHQCLNVKGTLQELLQSKNNVLV